MASPETTSAARRLAIYIVRGSRVDGDLRTLGQWAHLLGVSYNSLRGCCMVAGARPRDARDFTRALGAVRRLRQTSRAASLGSFLDVADPRTLAAFLQRAGLRPTGNSSRALLDQFLEGQALLRPESETVRVLRSLLSDDLARCET